VSRTSELLPSRTQTALVNRSNWARTCPLMEGLLTRPHGGCLEIIPRWCSAPSHRARNATFRRPEARVRAHLSLGALPGHEGGSDSV